MRVVSRSGKRYRLVRGVVAVGLAALLASWALAPSAHAYSCAQLPMEQYVEQADVVLVGTVRSGARPPWSWVVGARGQVEVERYLKGSGPPVVTVTSTAPFPFGLFDRGSGWPENRTGVPGVLFLTGSGGRYQNDICGGSRWLYPPAPQQLAAFRAEVEAVTGPGFPPEAGLQQGSLLGPAVVVAGLAAGVAVGAGAYVRRRRRGGHTASTDNET